MAKRLRKTLSALLLILAIAVTQIPASDVAAQSAASDFQIVNKTLVKYTGTGTDVIKIPSKVKVIGENAFENHNELVKVTIGEDVEEIAYNAFSGCNSLRTVEIGNSVKKIDSAAFSNCKNLKTVSLGTGLKTLGNGVFVGCNNLSAVDLNSENPYLAYQSGVIYDDEFSIIYQSLPGNKTDKYAIPDTVEKINAYAFWGNQHLKEVTLGNKLSDIPDYAFSNCMSLNKVTLPYSVRNISLKAFEDCVNLRKINFPESIQYIHDTAFDGCTKVDFTTVAGTYGETYANSLKLSDVEAAEYEDVEEAIVIPEETLDDKPAEEPEKEEPEPTESATPVIVTEQVENENLLGKSYIVSGKALIFIDNQESKVYSGNGESSSSTPSANSKDIEKEQDSGISQIQNMLNNSDEKGGGFPKYTIVNDEIIANQAYYLDTTLHTYEITSGITTIGDFAFARSNLTEIVIPEGVETIGYAAFYHCDSLQKVEIPSTVTQIGPSAFDHTPWLQSWKSQVGEDYLVVGDNILIAYSGTGGIVNIPEGVKQIAAGVFKDHTEITAVYIPDSVEVIGEEAFSGCINLSTLNGAKGIKNIKDRAFYQCALSEVVIPESVETIGAMAFALSENGTDKVTFAGEHLPALSYEMTTTRLTNEDYRNMAFPNMKSAVLSNTNVDISGTILDETAYGFRGEILTQDGEVVTNTTDKSNSSGESGISVRVNSESLVDNGNASATMPGNSGAYILKITDSDIAKKQISKAYAQIYGNREPAGLLAYDISLYEQQSNIPISKLGKQYITIMIPFPKGMGKENLHVVCTDENGQLEEVSYQIIDMEEGDSIQFTTTHFSSYGIYQYSDGLGAQAVVTDGSAVFSSLSGMKDNTPDTGDGPHPKWFLAIGLLCASAAVFFYKGRRFRGL